MYLERKTNYGFDADGLGCAIEEDEHLKLKEHKYYLKDYFFENKDEIDEIEGKKCTIGTCEVKEMDTSKVSPSVMEYWADADSDSFTESVGEYRDKEWLNLTRANKVVFISELKIRKKYRGMGYGTLLLRNIMKDIRTENTLFLLEPCPLYPNHDNEEKWNKYVKENMSKVKKFYRKIGYKPINRKSKYMAKYLK